MEFNEREENFREMASLGNFKAVTAYIRNGINIDSQNKMNNWTALHWACTRDNLKVIDILIRAGAALDLKNNKGQTPFDLCKSDKARALFPGSHGQSTPEITDDCSASSFTPNYLVNPELLKMWSVPDDAMIPGQADSSYARQMQFEASMSNDRTKQAVATSSSAPSAPAPAPAPSERELLVYMDKYDDESLLGAVLVDNVQNTTIDALMTMIGDELDGVPENFSVSRFNGQHVIPVSVKQSARSVGTVFRGAEDAVVLKEK